MTNTKTKTTKASKNTPRTTRVTEHQLQHFMNGNASTTSISPRGIPVYDITKDEMAELIHKKFGMTLKAVKARLTKLENKEYIAFTQPSTVLDYYSPYRIEDVRHYFMRNSYSPARIADTLSLPLDDVRQIIKLKGWRRLKNKKGVTANVSAQDAASPFSTLVDTNKDRSFTNREDANQLGMDIHSHDDTYSWYEHGKTEDERVTAQVQHTNTLTDSYEG